MYTRRSVCSLQGSCIACCEKNTYLVRRGGGRYSSGHSEFVSHRVAAWPKFYTLRVVTQNEPFPRWDWEAAVIPRGKVLQKSSFLIVFRPTNTFLVVLEGSFLLQCSFQRS